MSIRKVHAICPACEAETLAASRTRRARAPVGNTVAFAFLVGLMTAIRLQEDDCNIRESASDERFFCSFHRKMHESMQAHVDAGERKRRRHAS